MAELIALAGEELFEFAVEELAWDFEGTLFASIEDGAAGLLGDTLDTAGAYAAIAELGEGGTAAADWSSIDLVPGDPFAGGLPAYALQTVEDFATIWGAAGSALLGLTNNFAPKESTFRTWTDFALEEAGFIISGNEGLAIINGVLFTQAIVRGAINSAGNSPEGPSTGGFVGLRRDGGVGKRDRRRRRRR